MDDRLQSEVADEVQAFTQVQNSFIDDARVSPAAFRLFVTLKSYTSGRSASKIAFPSYETICQKSGIASYATIARAIRELESLGWITRIKRYGRSTLYTLRASPTVSVGLQKVKDQSYRNCNTSPTVSVEEQEVQNNKKKEQEVGGAPPSIPLVSVKGFGKVYTAHPDARVAAYLDIMGQPHITASNAQIILDRVSLEFVEVWKAVLVLWASSAWNPRNIAGMIERYEGDKNAKRFPKAASAVKIGDWTPAKGMYPQVPDKPQPAPAPRKSQRVETPDVVTIVNGVEVPF